METTLGRLIQQRARRIRGQILRNPQLARHLDKRVTHIPEPFMGNGPITLVVIGQDPTVRRVESRKSIRMVLNLDNKNGSLHKYLDGVCRALGLSLAKNVYATNLYKCLFASPPADDESLLTQHFNYWIALLQEELAQFPSACVITLGEPLLRQLVLDAKNNVSYYWNYVGRTKSNKEFLTVKADQSRLGREFFPFPHQPAIGRSKFYKKYLDDYCCFLRKALSMQPAGGLNIR